MKQQRHLLAVFVFASLMMLASSCFASIAVIPGVAEASLSRNDSIGLRFQVKNLGFERACISLETEQNDSYIDIRLSDDFFCLNESESTRVTVTIRTENAPSGLQLVSLEAESDEGNASATVSIFVGGEPEVELVAYPSDICIGNEERINVLVRNNSDEFKEVELQAENEMLLPYFERSRLDLMPFQERYVELRLHPSPYSSEGRHYVSMYAITEDEIVKKRLAIDAVDCGEAQRAEFSVRIDSGCFVVEKGETEKIYFKVKNRIDEEQKVYFSIGGGLNARLKSQSAWLEEDEERQFYFEVLAGQDTRAEDYNITLHVWNQEHSVEKGICVRPRKDHSVDVEVRKNNLVIMSCGSAVFTVILKNEGDYAERFELKLRNSHSKIEAILSEEELTLERHSSSEVYVSVNVSEEATEGDYSLTLEIDTARKDFEERLRFKVEGGEIEEAGGLQIVGYASSLRMPENSEKSLLLTLKNSGREQLDSVSVTLLGLPQGVSASFGNVSLLPGEERQLELNIEAEEDTTGEFDLVLQAGNFDYSDEKPLRLVVEPAQEEAVEAGLGLVGLFGAAGNALLGLAALIILVTALVIISRAMRSPSTQKKEAWMRG